MRLTLREAAPGATFWWICQGRNRVGRVAAMADGTGYVGVIGGTLSAGPYPTREQAFAEVGARWLGFDSAARLRARSRLARRVGVLVRRAGDHAISEMERGNFVPLEKMLTTAPTAAALVNALTRSLRRGRRR